MKKINSIKEYILNNCDIPIEDIKVFVEDGRVLYYEGNTNQNYKLKYNTVIYINNFTANIYEIILIILSWMKENQIISNPEEAIKFKVEIIDTNVSDIYFNLEFSEIIKAKDNEIINIYDDQNINKDGSLV